MKRPLITGCLFGAVTLLVAATGFSQVVKNADIESGVLKSLNKIAKQTRTGLVVTKIFQRHDLNLADGEVVWQIDTDPKSLVPGRNTIAVNVLVNGETKTQIKVAAIIKRFLDVPVVKRTLKRGSLVTANDIKWKRLEMKRAIDGLMVDDQDVIGMVSLRSVKAGMPLRMKWFAEPLAIDRGEKVKVKLVQGGLVINTTAVALSKGRVGDVIQLRNPKSHIRYEAKVSAPGQALIQTW
ncbi:MAG: flagellar basal body P-ring formation protein FlgA [Magnetococcales bacterium]|nr:flagellar basal body P-ring formation protein FlgA [Magnetococcales bacterium]